MAQRHALLFRRLLEKCGGMARVLELGVVRVQRSHLYRYTDPTSGSFAPSDVIEELQLLCGEAVFSAAMTEALPGCTLARDLLDEACETSCTAAELMRLVLTAKASPGGATPRMRMAIEAAIDRIAEELRQVRAANHVGAAHPGGAS